MMTLNLLIKVQAKILFIHFFQQVLFGSRITRTSTLMSLSPPRV